MVLDNIKKQANTLRSFFLQNDIKISHSFCLEAIAKLYGYKNWDTLCGELKKTNAGVLCVKVEWSSPKIIKLLRNGLMPFGTDYIVRTKDGCSEEFIEPHIVDAYISNYNEDQRERMNRKLRFQPKILIDLAFKP